MRHFLACAAVFAPLAAAASRPNILFWFPDETRAESLGTYGHPLTRTPNYDALAAKGTKFTQMHVLHTQCSPSRCAMVTGRYMHVEGHRTQVHLVQKSEANVFKYLKDAGYTTVTFGKNDMLAADAFNDTFTYWIDGSNGKTQSAPNAVKFLSSNPPEPFALFLPTHGSHPPYTTSDGKGTPFGTAGFFSFYDNGTSSYNTTTLREKAPLRPYGVPRKPGYHAGIVRDRNLTSLDDDYDLNAVYLDHVTQTDTNFGVVMDAMEKAGFANRTVVAVSSDHGDFGGDYHLVEKWPGGFDDILTRVPFIMHIPGAPGNRTIDTPVQLFDILPTFADLAGVNITHTHFGKSLLPMVTGESNGDPSRYAFSEGGYLYPTEMEPLNGGGQWLNDTRSAYQPRSVEEMQNCTLTPDNWRNVPSYTLCHGSPRAVMIRNTSMKLVYRVNGISELYDFDKDPRELNNLYGNSDYAAIQQDLMDKLLAWFLETSDVTPQTHDPRGLPPKPAAAVKATPTTKLRGAAPKAKLPNIVFYHPDETRAESLGTYGHPITKTPNYDRLAKQGTLFKQAHAPHSQCSPSRCAMITGRHMHVNGHRTQSHLVQLDELNLFSYLKDAGYHIQWHGKNDALAQKGFSEWVDNWWEGPDITGVVDFLTSDPPEPFFLYVPTLGAHPPYNGKDGIEWPRYSAPYYSFYNNGTGMYDPAEIKQKAPLRPTDIPNKPAYFSSTNGIPYYRNLTSLDASDPSFFYRLNSVYLTMVTAVDTYLGSILDTLNSTGLDQTTAIFTSSDHGDFAGDANLVEKWPGGMDDMLTHVPLIASIPGGVAGQVVDGPVSLLDILPTLVELAGSKVKHTQFGQSLVDVIMGNATVPPGNMVYTEGGYLWPTEIEPLAGDITLNPEKTYSARAFEELGNCTLRTPEQAVNQPNVDTCHGSPRVVMARNLTHKIVFRAHGVSELYLTEEDPRELNNLWDEPSMADTKASMLADLLQWFTLTSDTTPLTLDPRGFPHDKPPPSGK